MHGCNAVWLRYKIRYLNCGIDSRNILKEGMRWTPISIIFQLYHEDQFKHNVCKVKHLRWVSGNHTILEWVSGPEPVSVVLDVWSTLTTRPLIKQWLAFDMYMQNIHKEGMRWTPISIIFQLYHEDQFNGGEKNRIRRILFTFVK
jgi:hypothetical protein